MDRSQFSFRKVLGDIKTDLLPSIVVFLVALPLCLGIAIASGAPPVAGLITGIIGGLIVGSISGAPLQVSGPAAGLTVIVYDLFQRFELEVVMLVVLIAGLLQISAGLLRLGQWFRAVSPAVIQGMLAGIGVLIFASQFHIMADDKPRKGMELWGVHIEPGLANLLTIPETVYKIFMPLDGSTHQMAALLGVLTISVILLWKKIAPKKLKLIPGPLLGVTLATVLVFAASFVRQNAAESSTPLSPTVATITHVAEVEQLSSKIPDDILTGITLPDLTKWASAPLVSVFLAALAVALVASAETLLCATAVDQMHTGPRAKYDRELFAQGVGNSLCGLVGGIPMTGVIVRSAANVEAGGKTRASSIMHGLWLLVMVAALPFLLKQIPISALAAVLVFTGYKLVNLKVVKELAKFGWSEVFIYFATMITIVATDLLIGVMTGMVLAAIKLLYTFSHLEVRGESDAKQKRSALYLNGTATFLALPKLAAALDRVPADHELHVQFERLNYIDHACLDLLMNWEKQHEATGGGLVVDWDSLTAKFNGKKAPAISDANGKHNSVHGMSSQKRDRQPALAGQEDH